MNKVSLFSVIIIALTSCTNAPELETGEITTPLLLKEVFNQSRSKEVFPDARELLSREQIDTAAVPVLFVELESGQNGTLTPYPGLGVGQTWLGADGATVTLDKGVLKASRGIGNDLMGATSEMPNWEKINQKTVTYNRQLSYLDGNNKINKFVLECKMKKYNKKEITKIWDVEFKVRKYDEDCSYEGKIVKNTYYLDDQYIVRKSLQYHSETLGYLYFERLDQ